MSEGFELRNTPGKGEGVFATRSFRIGDTVMVGVIEKVLEGNHSHASQISEKAYVFHGGLVPKVNHSCDPNCGIHVNETNAHDFVAIKKIFPGDEITFDYAMRNYSIDYFGSLCQCGAENCRGRITGWKDLPEAFKKKYAGFIAPYLLDLDRRKESGSYTVSGSSPFARN